MRRTLAVVLAASFPACVFPVLARAQSCTEYGDPPATVFPDTTSLSCTGGKVLGPLPDPAGTPRYACLYAPASAGRTGPALPLVIYLHPSLFTADTLEGATNIPEMVESANLSDDRARPGFIVVAPEGRNTSHYYPSPDAAGTGWDNWYRNVDPTSATENVDVASIDNYLAWVEANYAVDRDRVYVTGWSNGAAMAYLYGLSRPAIAAIAVYSAPDPFHAFNDPCPQAPVAGTPANASQFRVRNLGVPTMHVHNDCDIAGICPNGERLMQSLLPIGVGFQDAIIDSAMLPANGCLDACGTDPDADSYPLDPARHSVPAGELGSAAGVSLGTANHVRWPHLWTSAMLDFFRAHPLSARPH